MITIGIFILPETNLLDFGGITQTLLEARDFGQKLDIIFCSEDEEVLTNSGISFIGLLNFNQVKNKKFDYFFIISANYKYVFSRRFKPTTNLLQWLNYLHFNGTTICAVCNSAFLLGYAGLLNGIKCTTHWKRTAELQSLFPQSKVQEDILFVEDNNIITSAGSSSGIDLALYIISKIKDEYLSHKIAREMIVFSRRNGSMPQQSVFLQYRNHFHNGIHKVQDYIIEHISRKLSIFDLSEVAGMSERNFCRIFKKETSVTVFNYINCIRRELVLQLIKNPDLSKRQIANKIGLESERQVNRILIKDFD